MKEKINKAYGFAREAHEGQKRAGTSLSYMSHPYQVFIMLKSLTNNKDILCAALLHDVIEDTKYTYLDIKKEFGKKVADIVLEVTKNDKGEFTITSREGLMIKLADTLHNIHDSNSKMYIQKKIKFVEEVNRK